MKLNSYLIENTVSWQYKEKSMSVLSTLYNGLHFWQCKRAVASW